MKIDGHNIAGKFYPVYEKNQSTIGKPIKVRTAHPEHSVCT
ncbi:hypothetical protein E5S67_02130 [Microcoleus sp. IPMA8]|uniref:Uncharacterized protein n=1 Tax=Microcoleus asticus IPMA8 TaxID=2563858 RepID=A0ABX2CVI5_9CYAN|nr:hypothetical protein [Microcoleus asticus IPMA8]